MPLLITEKVTFWTQSDAVITHTEMLSEEGAADRLMVADPIYKDRGFEYCWDEWFAGRRIMLTKSVLGLKVTVEYYWHGHKNNGGKIS